jgi:hypothetical protein
MAKEQNGLLRGARGTEAKLQNVAELALSVAFGPPSHVSGPKLDQVDGCVNCLPVFTWRLLLDEFSESVLKPPPFLVCGVEDRCGIHGRML